MINNPWRVVHREYMANGAAVVELAIYSPHGFTLHRRMQAPAYAERIDVVIGFGEQVR